MTPATRDWLEGLREFAAAHRLEKPLVVPESPAERAAERMILAAQFADWLTGEKSMPFGENGEHVTIKLIDFDDLEQNQYVVTQQYTFQAGPVTKRADLVMLINGIPIVLIEAKTPVRASQSWLDGALQIHDDYERNIPELFVPNAFSIATEGKEFRYGSIRMPVEFWGPWRLEDEAALPSIEEIGNAVNSMLRPNVVLDLLANFTSYATHKGKQRIKIIARYQQYEGTNKVVERVVAGHPKKGLIWHFQGSGKSLLMLFAARKLRLHPALKNPTVMILVDRIDLDSQISSTFYANDAANLVKAESRKDLEEILSRDSRKIIISTIHKFGDVEGVLPGRQSRDVVGPTVFTRIPGGASDRFRRPDRHPTARARGPEDGQRRIVPSVSEQRLGCVGYAEKTILEIAAPTALGIRRIEDPIAIDDELVTIETRRN